MAREEAQARRADRFEWATTLQRGSGVIAREETTSAYLVDQMLLASTRLGRDRPRRAGWGNRSRRSCPCFNEARACVPGMSRAG